MESDYKTNQDTSQENQRNKPSLADSSPFVFLLKKTEKIASAIYLMTNHFSDNEPLKRSLRDKSANLVSFMIGYKDLNGIQFVGFKKDVENRVIEIVSLLEISLNVGLISRMNFIIVQDEFVKLVGTIKSSPMPYAGASELDAINEGYFNVGGYMAQSKSPSENSSSKHGHITNILEHKRNEVSIGGSPEFKKNSRQNIILSIIRKKGEITIKDVSDVIKNCSEKTIQRELISLVSAGLIKRSGERRWSKYSIV
ncbi:MAG: DeoR family transcriptional regulator [Minisyncoccia bacterium]